MKKIILGLLVVSAVAFAETGKEASIPKVSTGDNVGVPLEVRANVIPEGARLVLTDGNGKVLDKIMFDHGNLVPESSSKLNQMVYLRRTDNKAFLASNEKTSGNVKFALKDASGQEVTQKADNFQLHGNSNDGTVLNTTLTFNDKQIALNANDTKAFTNIVSTVNVPADQAEGLYIGTGTFTATITM